VVIARKSTEVLYVRYCDYNCTYSDGVDLGTRKPLYMFKMVSLGDGTVGKTSCIMRYTEGSFGETYQATMGASLAIKNLEVETENGQTAAAQIVIWDLGGQPSFRELRLRYMAGASIAFIVLVVSLVIFSLARVVESERVTAHYGDAISQVPLLQ